MKSMPSARKQSVYKQGLQVSEKSSASAFISQLHERKEKTKPFSPKPPKISGRENLTPTGSTRNVSHSTDNAKIQHKSTSSSGKGLLSHKKSHLGKSCYFTGSLSSPVASTPIASSDLISYCSPFGSASSLRSSSNSRAESKTRKSTLSGSVSTFRTLVRFSQDFENQNSSTQLSSFSNHSAYDLTPTIIDKCSINLSSVSHMTADRDIDPRDRNGIASAEFGKGYKPSGLRMPSPKIGFFDKEHYGASFQFHIGSHSVSPHIDGAATKKAWDSSPITPRARGLSPSQYTQRKPVTDHKSPKPPLEPRKGISPLLVRESNSKARKVVDGTQVERKPSPRSTLSIVNKRTKTTVSGNKIGREGKVYNQASQESSPLLVEENEKENLLGSGDDVEGLTKYFEAINLKSRETMELAQNCLSKPRTRLPLADKNCVRNASDDLLMMQKKGMKTAFAGETIENERSRCSINA